MARRSEAALRAVVVAALLVAGATAGTLTRAQSSGGAGGASAAAQTVVLTVEGMVCEGCAGEIDKALRAVQGVQSVNVAVRRRTVTVVFDPKRTNANALATAVERIQRAPAPPFRVTAKQAAS